MKLIPKVKIVIHIYLLEEWKASSLMVEGGKSLEENRSYSEFESNQTKTKKKTVKSFGQKKPFKSLELCPITHFIFI